MNNLQIRVIFDRKHESTTKKTALVQLELTFEGKRKFISTHVKVLKNQFKNGRICGRGDAESLNQQINDQISCINDLVQEYNKKQIPFSFDALERLQKGNTTTDFITFLDERITARYISPDTKRQHRKVLNFLKNEYKYIKYFYDLTPGAIMLMDEYLHKRNIGTPQEPKPMKQTSIHVYHKVIKHYINEAILQGLMETNPYKRIKLDRGQSEERTILNTDEIDMIYNYSSKSILECKVRDLFIVQCYTGLSYADLMAVDFSTAEKRGEITVIRDNRIKTGTNFYITLLPRVVEVLNRYGGKLPHLAYDVYNRNLKAVALAAGVHKHVTTHIGRHTFATTIALGSGIPIEVLARMLGHTDIKTTQIYAKIMPEQVLQGFNKISKVCG